MFYYRVYSKILFRTVLIAACCLVIFAASPATAQELAAPVNSFNGEMIVSPASQPLPALNMANSDAPAILTYSGDVRVVSVPQPANLQRAVVGLPLPDGYRIIAPPGASATLTLPEGSQIHIREMSIVELNGFAWDPQANLRGMLMSLYAGSVRVIMSPAEKERGSFFEIKTPNALISLHFSQPDVEVIYAAPVLENMTALLEEGMTVETEEAALWQNVLAKREEDVIRRQNESRAQTQFATLQNDNAPQLTTGAATLVEQGGLAKIGLIRSEEDALLQALIQQRDEFAKRVAAATQSQAAAPVATDIEQWQWDGLIVGDDEAGKGATFVFAYTTKAIFMNRLTRETRTVQPGQRALVRGLGITMTVLNGSPMLQDPPRNMGTVFALDSQRHESQESSIQNQEGVASTGLPGSAGHPESWSNRPRAHNIEITIAE